MLNMTQINLIRDLAKSGYKISEIHELTKSDPKTIVKYLEKDDFSPTPPVKIGRSSIVAPFNDKILGYLEEDKKHWKKQWHTAKRIFERLRDEEGYTGSYDAVQKYVKRLRNDSRTTGTQELVWEPGCAQVDFGEADMYEDTDCVRRKYLTVSFPYSNDGYSQVFRGETAECVCQGLQDVFQYIGGVPYLLIFDNATGVGRRVMDKITETELFARFRAHYGFQIRFCNPYAGYEKGNVENKVGTNRRSLLVPVPRYHDVEEYNKALLGKHEIKAAEIHYKKGVVISELFEEDRKHLLPLPLKPFNVCRYETKKADGFGNICLDGKHYYSTKPENHNKKVMIAIRAHYIDILEPNGDLLVRHQREYGDERTDTRDYSTSLEMLSKNVGAWENSGFRKEVPDILRDYIDSQSKPDRKSTIQLLNELAGQYGVDAAVNALQMAIQKNSVNKSDAAILAARITGYGIDTPPEPGPSLAIYDQAFLPPKEEGWKEAGAC
ncbi:MAG: IS21 family transposase [Clostridia bacterium]|nr:IS21 family transposase [Clostridia bacterium]